MERVFPVVGILVLLLLWNWVSPHAVESFAIGTIIHVLLPIGFVAVVLGLVVAAFKNAFKGW